MDAYPNLRHVRLFDHALRANSLSKAAEAVRISQPAASQAISRLEQHFGGQLFERGGTGFILTERGQIVAARAARTLELLRQASADHGSRSGGRQEEASRFETHATIAQLRAMAAFARTGSFPAAARRLGQAETSVQRAAREFERIGDVPLFEGRQQSVRLTAEGRGLAASAGLVLKELESARQEVAELDGSFGGHIVIGTLPLVRTKIIPEAVALWSKKRPQASIEMLDGSYDALMHSLSLGEIDMLVGALRESPPPRGFAQAPLFTDGLSIVARAGHPLLARAKVAVSDLSLYPWVLPRKGTPTRTIFDAIAAELGIGTASGGLVEVGSLVTIRGILLETDRLTMLSFRQIVHERNAGLLGVVPVDLPPTDRPIGVTTRKGWKPTAIQNEFLDALRVAAAR